MREIAYQIQSHLTLEQGCLVLDLFEVEKQGYQYHLYPINLSHPVNYWRALAQTSIDKELFQFLLKEELSFQQRMTGKMPHIESLSLKQLHISPAQTPSALKLFAATQKLYCQGKQLVIDLFSSIEFYYEGIAFSDGKLEIQGRLRWRDQDVSLNDCEAIGPGKPLWFIKGLSLKTIGSFLSWKQVQELRKGPLILEGGAKHHFLENLDPQDPDAPKLVMKEGSLDLIQQNSNPYPILRLKDRWGACADLYMDYGQGHLINFHDSQSIVKDAKGKALFKRQIDVEANWEKDLLETDFIKKAVGSSHYYCPMNCVAKSLTFLLEIGWHIQDWQSRQVIKQTGLNLQLSEQKQTIEVKGQLQYDTYEADVGQVVGAFNRREHFIQLSSNTVGLISKDSTSQVLQDLATESEITGQSICVKKNRVGALHTLLDFAPKNSSLQDLQHKLQNFSCIQESLPSHLFQGELRPYQQQGVNWLAFLYEYGFHGILADEMGLGKTIQILAFLSQLPAFTYHLIVMPTSLLFNWRHEIQHFLPQLHVVVHQGPKRAKKLEEFKKNTIILTSYTTLRVDLMLFKQLSYTCLILDEAQTIKNANTQIFQSVCQLDAQIKISLTGTPVENHLHELWSHFRFLMPDLFGTQESFEADIQVAQADRRYLDRIKKKIHPFLLRRRKLDVLTDLPERIDQVVWIEMSEEQRIVYDQLLAGFKNGLLKKVESEGIQKHRMDVLEALLRLRQVCCHPLLVSHLIDQDTIPNSAKFDALIQDLETLTQEGHKVLVYSQFTSMLKLMTQTARERKWSYGYLDGATINREEVVTRFQQDDSQNLFFVSLKAGGVGLNLTAADYVYLYDPWWNEAVEEQAINRAHRIGRKESVIAKRFVVTESVEEKMMKLKSTKRLLIDDLLEAETISTDLSVQDLQYLFS